MKKHLFLLLALAGFVRAEQPRLTPRPVEGVQSLNGTWRFSAEPAAGFESLKHAPESWRDIAVPGEWVMQGFAVPAEKAGGYFRTFTLPGDLGGRRFKLRFDTVHSLCSVWVNGALVGTNESCFLPFEFDVTSAVKPGNNTLAVSVTSESTADVLASASQYAGHPLGGITRAVQLISLPEAHFASLVLDADFDPATSNGLLRGAATLSVERPLSVITILLDAQSNAVGVAGGLKPSIDVPAAAAWDPEHPRLYRARVELRDGERLLEAVERRVGFRRVEVRGNQLLVNGRPVKLRGACRHETDPERGRSLTPERWRQDAELFRAANVNYIRTSHYPPPGEFLDLCDEYGFFVECEAPFCWVQHGANKTWQSWDYRDPKFLPLLVRGNLANVDANRGHPSVILWSLANESRWSEQWAEVNRLVKEADPTRPTSFHDQCWGDYNNAHSTADIANFHYPDERGPEACDREARPVLFGEYCHVQTYNRRELAADPGVRDDWGRGFARMYELMYRSEGCLGGAIWAGIDDVFCLPGGKYIGYGMWGSICDGWRREKPEAWHVRKAYSPVRVGVRSLPSPTAVLPLVVPVENRYNFTDLSEVGIAWSIGSETGAASVAAAPRSAAALTITPTNPVRPGATLKIAFTDPRGFVCEEEELPIGPRDAAPSFRSSNRATVAEDAETLTLRSKDFSVAIDRRTGLIREGRAGETVVLTGGPSLMVLPLQSGACEPVDLGVWPPLNACAANWKAGAVRRAGNVIRVEGSSDEAEGWYEIAPGTNASVVLRYAFTSRQAVQPRQWGLVLRLPREMENLNWRRDAQWTTYAFGHIGRPVGTARAKALEGLPPYPSQPRDPWSDDATALGGNDFTSTKSFIREAGLRNFSGRGIRIRSDGHQAVRAFVEAGQVGLLVCGFHSGGGDGFFNPHMAVERRPLKAGSVMVDEIRLDLIP